MGFGKFANFSMQLWAASMPVPSYAIDDQTAIKVVDGTVDVISEGHWKRFDRGR
jgi:dipeptidase E